jgi:hypothetical protein
MSHRRRPGKDLDLGEDAGDALEDEIVVHLISPSSKFADHRSGDLGTGFLPTDGDREFPLDR